MKWCNVDRTISSQVWVVLLPSNESFPFPMTYFSGYYIQRQWEVNWTKFSNAFFIVPRVEPKSLMLTPCYRILIKVFSRKINQEFVCWQLYKNCSLKNLEKSLDLYRWLANKTKIESNKTRRCRSTSSRRKIFSLLTLSELVAVLQLVSILR